MKVYNEVIVDSNVELQEIDMEHSLGITFELDSGLRVRVSNSLPDVVCIRTPDGVLWIMPGVNNMIYVKPIRRI